MFSSASSAKYLSLSATFLAVLLFVPLFAFRRIDGLDFWWWMSLNVAVVVFFTFITAKSYFRQLIGEIKQRLGKKIGLGIVSAVLLYLVFLIGNEVSRIILPFAENDVGQVYGFKDQASVLRIALLMTVLIGPGEEIFWRGYLQRLWSERLGKISGYLLSVTLYALVHAASGNIMLVFSAAVCGLFWGILYLRYRSVVLICISHSLWDLLIFVIWPVGS